MMIKLNEAGQFMYLTFSHQGDNITTLRKIFSFVSVADAEKKASYRNNNIITVTSQWARLCFKSPASPLFTQPFIQAQIKENIKAPRHLPLCKEFTGDRWIPRTKGQ